VGILFLAAIALTRLHSYLLFHSFAELFSIIIAAAVFIYAWNARHLMKNNYLLIIGVALLFSGIIDLLHTLSYQGMGVFTGSDTNLPTSLWIAARYLQAGSFLLAPLLIEKRLRPRFIFSAYFLITTCLLLSIFYWGNFPVTYIESSGLTSFKIISEYVISVIFLLGALVLWRKRAAFTPRVWWLMMTAILVTILSELAFTQYIGVYGNVNMIGHLLKIVAFYLIYEAILITGFQQPMAVLFQDLSRVNQALRESEKIFRLLADNASDIIFRYRLAPDPGYEYISPSTTAITGYTPEEHYADPQMIRRLVHPEDRAQLELFLNQPEQIQNKPFILRYMRKDSRVIWIEAVFTLVYDGESNRIAAQGAARDITERKRVEQLKDDFIGMVSHELRTPLTVIAGAIQTAMDKRVSPEDRSDLLNDAMWGAHSLDNMLENMLELSRHQASRLKLEKKEIDAAGVIRVSINKILPRYPGRTVDLDVPRSLPCVCLDPERLERILCNLLDNAFKYSARDGRVHVFATLDDACLTIGVKNEGSGIAQADLELLFEPFNRLRATDQVKGIGLGLVVCKRLVEAHGGRVWAESEPGHGATFKFTIPLDRAPAGPD
jgi:PAS domain S-box-containing protein